jgi:hypothetical protein
MTLPDTGGALLSTVTAFLSFIPPWIERISALTSPGAEAGALAAAAAKGAGGAIGGAGGGGGPGGGGGGGGAAAPADTGVAGVPLLEPPAADCGRAGPAAGRIFPNSCFAMFSRIFLDVAMSSSLSLSSGFSLISSQSSVMLEDAVL